MGHNITPITYDDNAAFKLPIIEASIIPLVWMKCNRIGNMHFVIQYDKAEISTLKSIARNGGTYEKAIANELISKLEQEDNVSFDVELSIDSAGKFLKMFDDILPINAEFPKGKWKVVYDHFTEELL